jgi:hypothetical protein
LKGQKKGTEKGLPYLQAVVDQGFEPPRLGSTLGGHVTTVGCRLRVAVTKEGREEDGESGQEGCLGEMTGNDDSWNVGWNISKAQSGFPVAVHISQISQYRKSRV